MSLDTAFFFRTSAKKRFLFEPRFASSWTRYFCSRGYPKMHRWASVQHFGKSLDEPGIASVSLKKPRCHQQASKCIPWRMGGVGDLHLGMFSFTCKLLSQSVQATLWQNCKQLKSHIYFKVKLGFAAESFAVPLAQSTSNIWSNVLHYNLFNKMTFNSRQSWSPKQGTIMKNIRTHVFSILSTSKLSKCPRGHFPER